ncbi:MAG: PEP-CTERM sorting domain-containing protein [Planctomycetota bacterium]
MKVHLLSSVVVTLLCLESSASLANADPISVIRGHHPVDTGTHSGSVGLIGLGHTTTVFTDDAGGWAGALALDDTIVVEQRIADVTAWVSSGNRLIILGDFTGTSNIELLNGVLSASMTVDALGADLEPFAQTAAAAGTTFADDAATLFGLSSHHEVLSGLPGDATTFYEGAGDAIVFRSAVGDGDVFYIGWEHCCGGSIDQGNDWYGVLDSAIAFSSPSVPEPGTVSMVLAALACGGFLVRRRR